MVRKAFVFISVILIISVISFSLFMQPIWWVFVILAPLIMLRIYDMTLTKHAIRRNFPVIGNLRYLLEGVRPEIMQYFVETDTEGRPFDRIDRSLIYRRAKNVSDTSPFGTQEDPYKDGYEWINHSMYAKSHHDYTIDSRVLIGEQNCTKPYSTSIYNISAMSFGSLSDRALEALNGGAKLGNFAHNTGEGGVSPYHLKYGGDVIWQIGTGYFGCRNLDGTFSKENFQKTATQDSIQMIEIKLSQGAKPGHGGILPAVKNTPEIAKIRGVEPGIAVLSPPGHSAFSNPIEFMNFVRELRELSGGKPVGFKLCIGVKKEFEELCEAMVNTGITPNYIAVDGGEGGTGAAPVEFADSVGTPFLDGLAFVHDTLVNYELRNKIKLSASGKIVSGFHIVRALAMGADFCQSARGMMMSLGCIQALQCNSNKCPVGIATQKKSLIKGLDVTDKKQRVASFHKKTIDSFKEIVLVAGLTDKDQLTRSHINHRVESNIIKTYEEMYPSKVYDKTQMRG